MIVTKRANEPVWTNIYAYAQLPEELRRLDELAHNLWWVWNPKAQNLFRRLSPELWEATEGNPVTLTRQLSSEEIAALIADKSFMAELDDVYADFRAYLAEPADTKRPSVAYFSMEYGLTNILKIYSGGLGVLAGDYLKEASDSNVRLTAVGFLYRYGYFTQTLSPEGQQEATYEAQDFTQLPIEQVFEADGKTPMVLEVPYATHVVACHVWKVNVGRISLYLLDTDIAQNSEWDRPITHKLYGGDWENRLKQEFLLGIGGVLLLKKLGISKDVYHMNEGHAAFMNAQLSRSPKLLREETWEQMWSPGLGEERLGNRAKAGEMGLGYFELIRNGRRIVEHSGDLTSGWHSKFELYPEENTGIFISYNGQGNESSSSLREDLAQGFADRYFPGDAVKASGSKDSADRARQVAGSYVVSRSFWATFPTAWVPVLGSATIEHAGDGKLIFNGDLVPNKSPYVEVEPWVWRQVDGAGVIAAQVEDGKVVSLSPGPAYTLLPTTPVQQALAPVFGICLVLLLVVTVAWPIGALRRRRALKRGQEVGAPASWLTRVARGGGAVALAAQFTWIGLLLVIMANPTTFTDGSFTWLISVARCAQVLQALGVVAVIPAAVDLVMSLRRRAGWRRITMSAILLAALVALAWWAWAGNALVPRLGL